MAVETIWLFSYGTLRRRDVQLTLFGRALHGEPDALVGYRRSVVTVTDVMTIAISGGTVHPVLHASGDPGDRIEGMALAMRAADLPIADDYEADAYRRVAVTLASGRAAFVYTGAMATLL